MKLTGKTREEVSATLAGADREQLITLIHSLVTLDRLYTARQIADAEGCNKRDVLADMKAGRFEDPIFGAGFFVRARNSFRVTGTAVQAWRRRFFVRARRAPDLIPLQKNGRAGSDTDLNGETAGQRRDLPTAAADLGAVERGLAGVLEGGVS